MRQADSIAWLRQFQKVMQSNRGSLTPSGKTKKEVEKMKDYEFYDLIKKAILKNPDSFRAVPIQETMKETKESEAKNEKDKS